MPLVDSLEQVAFIPIRSEGVDAGAAEGEAVKFGTGSDIAGPMIQANAFYRLELDIEVKRDAEFLLEVLIGGSVSAEYFLRSGGSIIAKDANSIRRLWISERRLK